MQISKLILLTSLFALNFSGAFAYSDSKESTSKKSSKKKVEATSEKLPEELLNNLSRKYRKSSGAQMDVMKTVILAVLKKEKPPQSGQLSLANGKLRLEFLKPDKSLFVFDNKVVWVVEYAPAELGGSAQVGKIPVKKNSKDQALLAFLLGQEGVWKEFRLKEKSGTDQLKLVLEPKTSGRFAQLTQLTLVIDSKKLVITQLAYMDELKNQTKFEFSKVNFGAKVPSKLFAFVPPPGASVTEY